MTSPTSTTAVPSPTSDSIRRFTFWAAIGVVVLSASYFVPLVMGFITLPSPDVAFIEPWFSMMEVLILLMAPVIVALTIGIHYTTSAGRRPFTLAAVVFMGVSGGITSGVHFTVLTLSHRPDFVHLPWLNSMLRFQWPSVTYDLDILAWDVFFPLSVLCLAVAFGGSRLRSAIRVLLLVSGALAIGGLVGVALDDMNVRNIGIVGYAVVYPIAAVLMIRAFRAGRRRAATPLAAAAA
jgi:hypothetical protein